VLTFGRPFKKDGVICLECGSMFKYLPGHLCKHNLSSHEYRAKWGYNRTTPLEGLSTRRKKRRNAIAMKFGAMTPSNAHQKATKARQGHGLPYRPERRLIDTEAARARLATGFRRTGQRVRSRVGTSDGIGSHRYIRSRSNGDLKLSKEDHKILALRKKGRWPSEIAALLGIGLQSVRYRLDRLKNVGFTFSPRTAPRPIPHRKVTNDELLTLARSGLSIPEIATRLGMGMANAHRRIKRLTEWR
jgi:DNA-binding CsgD family transcriptional regulator